MQHFRINPCKGCSTFYAPKSPKKDCGCGDDRRPWTSSDVGIGSDINDMNNCVTETAAAFSGMPSNNFIRGTDAAANWSECMVDMMKKQGRDPCDFQLSMAPVFVNPPHYFPRLLYETNDPDHAYKECAAMCSGDRNAKECVRACAIDRLSVDISSPKENFDWSKFRDSEKKYQDYIAHEKVSVRGYSVPVFVIVIAAVILFVMLLLLLSR